MMLKTFGKVYTFYSYKGGVGRSMALANVAALLSKWGKKVLIIDWDLEAPGLHEYFNKDFIKKKGDVVSKQGILDILLAIDKNNTTLHWENEIVEYRLGKNSLHLLSAGKQDALYLERLQSLNWQKLIQQGHIYDYLNQLRQQWIEEYDFVLIDSRTGVTGIGDICTVLLPDVLVLLFVSNRQNISGIKKIVKRASVAHNRLPVDRSKLLMLPVPCRTEPYTEHKQSLEWQKLFAEEFKHQYYDWIPKTVEANDVLTKIFVPYISNWSFGEALPVWEEENELYNPTSIGNAYARLANLILNNLDWNTTQKISEEVVDRESAYHIKIESFEKEKEIYSAKAKRINIAGIITGTALFLLLIYFLVSQFRTSSAKTAPVLNSLDETEVAENDTLYLHNGVNSFGHLILNEGAVIKISDTVQTAQIIAVELSLKGYSQILADGKNGKTGENGKNGFNGNSGKSGQNGEAGTSGENGKNGKSLTMIITKYNFTEKDSLIVDVSGGNGGNGGNGGKGGNGSSPNCKSVFKERIKGGKGGDGGTGGNGGNGGSPGQLNIIDNSKLEETITLLEKYGRPGKGGLGGERGLGGKSKYCNGIKSILGSGGREGKPGADGDVTINVQTGGTMDSN